MSYTLAVANLLCLFIALHLMMHLQITLPSNLHCMLAPMALPKEETHKVTSHDVFKYDTWN